MTDFIVKKPKTNTQYNCFVYAQIICTTHILLIDSKKGSKKRKDTTVSVHHQLTNILQFRGTEALQESIEVLRLCLGGGLLRHHRGSVLHRGRHRDRLRLERGGRGWQGVCLGQVHFIRVGRNRGGSHGQVIERLSHKIRPEGVGLGSGGGSRGGGRDIGGQQGVLRLGFGRLLCLV